MKVVESVTNRKKISNLKVKAKSKYQPGGSSCKSEYEIISYMKENLEKEPAGRFLIYRVDPDKAIVFKTSAKKLEIAKQMLKIDHFMAKEYCFFDGKVNRAREYVTLTASVYHPVLCKQVSLANMECKDEDSLSVEEFWRIFNAALQEFDESDIKFMPRGWVTDMKGSNFIGLKKIYGDDIEKRIKGWELHIYFQ